MSTFSNLNIPQITAADLFAFHEAHFSQHAIINFKTTFLNGKEQGALSYYQPPPDASSKISGAGDGRDEYGEDNWEMQHSAFHNLINSQEGASDIQHDNIYFAGGDISQEVLKGILSDVHHTDCEFDLEALGDTTGGLKKAASQKKRRRRKNNSTKRPHEKPDLRKRTWDVVDSGLGSLDYDDMEERQSSSFVPSQRRQVTYDDD